MVVLNSDYVCTSTVMKKYQHRITCMYFREWEEIVVYITGGALKSGHGRVGA